MGSVAARAYAADVVVTENSSERPLAVRTCGGQGPTDSRSESGARQIGMEADLDTGAKRVCPKGEVQDAPSQPT